MSEGAGAPGATDGAAARAGGIGAASVALGTESVEEIGVGLVGYAFMGKAHSNAYKTITYMTWPPPLRPRSSPSPGATRRPLPPPHTATASRRPTPTGATCSATRASA